MDVGRRHKRKDFLSIFFFFELGIRPTCSNRVLVFVSIGRMFCAESTTPRGGVRY